MLEVRDDVPERWGAPAYVQSNLQKQRLPPGQPSVGGRDLEEPTGAE